MTGIFLNSPASGQFFMPDSGAQCVAALEDLLNPEAVINGWCRSPDSYCHVFFLEALMIGLIEVDPSANMHGFLNDLHS